MTSPNSLNSSTPCWYCKHLQAIDPRTMIASCPKVGSGGTHHSRQGCAQFERLPGVDDDLWEPKAPVFVPLPTPRRDVGRDGWWTEPRRAARPVTSPPPPVPVSSRWVCGFERLAATEE